MSVLEKQKCVIIGSGPAGYTAAIYAARAGLNPVLFTGKEPGGQLMITTDVDNFPGYPAGIMGPEMMEDFRKQAERFGTEIRYELITGVDFTGPVHTLTTESGKNIEANTVIISTGATAKWLGLDSEKRLMNKGVSACAVCDGFFFRGMDVAVVGAGDTAAEEASYLANETEAVRVKNNVNGLEEVIPVKGFFVAIGHQPNTSIFEKWLSMDSSGYLIAQQGSTKTDIPGVFVSGDAADKVYRQAITAAGTGCMAALDAERYLVEHGIS